MKKVNAGSILDYTDGVIVCQVNCVNKDLDKGLIGAITSKYPEVKNYYDAKYNRNSSQELFGQILECEVAEGLTIACSYSQFFSGNGPKENKKFTNVHALITNIEALCDKYPDRGILVPNKIGYAHGNGNWDEIYERLEKLNKDNLILVTSIYYEQEREKKEKEQQGK